MQHRFFFCNSYALLGESRGYCTKTKQEWPDSGSTLENIFCNFYEINSSLDFFCIANILVSLLTCSIPMSTCHAIQSLLHCALNCSGLAMGCTIQANTPSTMECLQQVPFCQPSCCLLKLPPSYFRAHTKGVMQPHATLRRGS